ncbi:MAG: hypothetical protein ACRERC_10640 [Candidatus Binatia bacterium]
MKWIRLALLLQCLPWLGCASEGGIAGTGASAVSGNITLVSEQTALQDAALPFPIRVSISEFPGIESVTDAAGAFALRGDFSGAVTLQFANADSGADIGPLALEIPAGSSTLLENIEIRTNAPRGERVRPAAVRQRDVFGRIDVVDCSAGVLLVSDDGRPPRQFMVRVTADTVIVRRDGTQLRCGALSDGLAVQVEGALRLADQTIVAAQITVLARRAPPAGGPPRTPLADVVAAARD